MLRFRGHGASRAGLSDQHEVSGPERRPQQSQQQGSDGSFHLSGSRFQSAFSFMVGHACRADPLVAPQNRGLKTA